MTRPLHWYRDRVIDLVVFAALILVMASVTLTTFGWVTEATESEDTMGRTLRKLGQTVESEGYKSTTFSAENSLSRISNLRPGNALDGQHTSYWEFPVGAHWLCLLGSIPRWGAHIKHDGRFCGLTSRKGSSPNVGGESRPALAEDVTAGRDRRFSDSRAS